MMQRLARARIHAALGDEQRLTIVDHLVAGDRTPRELGELLEMPGNLLAHHLNVLEVAGIIERRRSEGDRRRRYLVLRRDVLGEALILPTAPSGRVVFVCTHNSARSPYAAAAYRSRTGRGAASAGRTPAAAVNPLAVEVAAERGIDLGDQLPSGYEALEGEFDLVVSVCDRAGEDPGLPTGRHVHWSVPDPVAVGEPSAFRAAFDELDRRLDAWVGTP